ncbi:uncharacterized protein LOC106769631 [Vigna radiata var. radiata]|uniref:Uncharacterized protein LOC106769631 n=1 Tax=Vigna radiata var. radiata TaxID=3916 RepID=A0A1S3UXK2_VIGRR|nr:uncharacterized protein LOC106769631 [Vigna radiata var. radiata]
MGTPAVSNVPGYIISKLEGTFIESLNIQDALKLEHAYEVDRFDNLYVEEENLSGGFEPQETKLEIKCLKDCSTFSYSDICLPSSCSDEETDKSFSKQSRQNYCSVSLEAPAKLVSAMKGSREKERGSQIKLTVKWAPDVYDPVPTLSSHTVKHKKHQKPRMRKSEKKNGKKSQKVSYSRRSSSSKDKPYRNRWLHSGEEVFEASTEVDDLKVANHDSYCATSYLKASITKVHWPIGEAL